MPKTSSIFRRALVSSLLILVIVPSWTRSSNAFVLAWSNGSTDIAVPATAACTLFVRSTSPNEQLAPGWSLIWGTDDVESSSIQATATQSLDARIEIDSILEPSDAELESNEVSTFSRTSIAGSQNLLAVRLLIKGGARASFKLAAPLGSTISYPPSGAPIATVNGGVIMEPPVTMSRATALSSGGRLLVTSYGSGLPLVHGVSIEDSTGAHSVPGRIVAVNENSLVSEFDGQLPSGQGWLVAESEGGRTTTARLASAPDTPTDVELIVRFAPGQVTRRVSEPTSLADYDFASPLLASRLAQAGPLRMMPMFPHVPVGKIYDLNLAGEPIRIEDLSNVSLLTFSSDQALVAATGILRGDEGIVYLNGNTIGHAAAATPNDSLYALQWALNNNGSSVCGFGSAQAGVDIGAALAWNTTFGAASETVAVIDTGLDIKHKEFLNHYALGPNFYGFQSLPLDTLQAGNRHGTAVAGTIAALTNNLVGLAGVAGQCIPMAIRIGDPDGNSNTKALANGIQWTYARKLPILNLSWGFTLAFFKPYTLDPTATTLSIASDVCLNAFNKGQLLVAAMGNDNAPLNVYPASFAKRVTAIGAVTPNGARWQDVAFYPNSPFQRGSNYGSWIDFVAPGGMWMTAPSFGPYGYYDLTDCGYLSGTWFSGTSSSAPIVSGVAALIHSVRPILLGEDIVEILRRSAIDLGNGGFDDSTGYGLVNAEAALEYLAPTSKAVIHGTIGAYGTSGSLTVRDSSVVTRTFMNVPGLTDGTYTNAIRYRLAGRATYSAGFSGTPDVWARSSGTLGWPDTSSFDHEYEVNHATLLAGSVSATACSLQTFVYRIPGKGWFPARPESARAAWTALGTSALVAVDGAGQRGFELRTTPNPVVRDVRIDFRVPQRQWIRVDLIGVNGRLVRTLQDGVLEPGRVRMSWDGCDVGGRRCPTGIYFCRVTGGDGEARTKLTLIGARTTR